MTPHNRFMISLLAIGAALFATFSARLGLASTVTVPVKITVPVRVAVPVKVAVPAKVAVPIKSSVTAKATAPIMAQPSKHDSSSASQANINRDVRLLTDGFKIAGKIVSKLLDSGDPSQCSDFQLVLRKTIWISETVATDAPSDRVRVAYCLSLRGQYGEAESIYRQTLTTAEAASRNSNGALTENILAKFARLLDSQGRYSEAEPLYRRTLAVAVQTQGQESFDAAVADINLAVFLGEVGQYDEAQSLLQQSLAIVEKTKGPQSLEAARTSNDIASLDLQQGHFADAEPLFRSALAIFEKIRPGRADTATGLSNLAYCLYLQKRHAEAEPLFAQALSIRQAVLRPDHPDTIGLRENIALNYVGLHRFEDAAINLRIACAAQSSVGSGHDLSGDAAQAARLRANRCSTYYSLVLAAWAQEGGGSSPGDHANALALEAFLSGQRAMQSTVGDAIARSAALTAAKAAGVGAEAEAYETALLERDSLDVLSAKSEGAEDSVDANSRRKIEKARDDAVVKIDRLQGEIKSRAPLYWDYRASDPVSVDALQASTGPDSQLLRNNEALVMLFTGSGQDQGLVFAITKEKFAWARLGLNGAAIRERVMRLRAQIDPEAFSLSKTAASSSPATDRSSSDRIFSRAVAYELYQALFGAASIQAVIKDKPVLLVVPSGPLTSLPPGLLVTASPAGGTPGDSDPTALRGTAWLLRSKAVALLPSVASLRMLRQILPLASIRPTDPLLAFADPTFRHDDITGETSSPGSNSEVRSLNTYFRGGMPLQDALATLPQLPGTRVEGEALRRALGAAPESLLTGLNASKVELMARNSDGRLAKVRVLEFATHGLIAGDLSELTEPALVLAVGDTPQDELLLASEATTLKLNADWVLLSACNTAGPDTPGAEGLSGLTRSFFYAGAKSILVSHWSVRDDVAQRIIPNMLLAAQRDPQMSRAQALRQASLAILDDPGLDAADPSAWAPFTLVGEGGSN
jgi:CHAT domain-containing protein/tetratricopeptide (TPR) repeat protein